MRDGQLSLDTPNICNISHAEPHCVNLHAVLCACQVLDKVHTYNFIWFQCLLHSDAFPWCMLPLLGCSCVCVRGQAGAESLMDGVQGSRTSAVAGHSTNPVNRTASTGLASPARQNFVGCFSPGNGKAERVQGDI